MHYAFALYILLFNSMVLNIAAYGQKHIHVNTVVIGAFSLYVCGVSFSTVFNNVVVLLLLLLHSF